MRLSRMNRPTSYSSTTPTPPWIWSARRQTRTAPSVPYHFTSGVTSRTSRAACSSRPNSARAWRTAASHASAQEPAVVALGRRGGGEASDVGARLRLGHRDRPHDLALRQEREVSRLLLVGAEPEDERRRRVPSDPVLHLRRKVGPREHLGDHHRDREWEAGAAELRRHRRGREAEIREPAQVLRHRLVHPNLAAVANDAELVDLRGSRGDLRRDVLPGH